MYQIILAKSGLKRELVIFSDTLKNMTDAVVSELKPIFMKYINIIYLNETELQIQWSPEDVCQIAFILYSFQKKKPNYRLSLTTSTLGLALFLGNTGSATETFICTEFQNIFWVLWKKNHTMFFKLCISSSFSFWLNNRSSSTPTLA